MARPSNVTRVIINGHLEGGEVFNWGFWLDGTPTSQSLANTWAQTLADYFETYALTALAGTLDADSGYDGVTIYAYPDPAQGAAFTAEAAIDSGTGTSVAASLPQQVAWVVTTRTGLPGRARRGRMYIPVNALALTNHQLTTTQNASLLDAVATYVQNINNNADLGNVTVVSQVGVGQENNVSQLTSDSRLDIQRRRANSESPLFSASEAITS